jgi:uncharacterized membrane protein SirB2
MGNSEKLQIFVQHASRVSRALWPIYIRSRSPARRRSAHPGGEWRTILPGISRVHLFLTLIIFFLLILDTMAAGIGVYPWHTALILAIILVILIAFLSLHQATKRRKHSPSAGQRYLLHSKGTSWEHAPSVSKMPRFPETPVPTTPLVRVFETVDLSQSDVEHFMDMI